MLTHACTCPGGVHFEISDAVRVTVRNMFGTSLHALVSSDAVMSSGIDTGRSRI